MISTWISTWISSFPDFNLSNVHQTSPHNNNINSASPRSSFGVYALLLFPSPRSCASCTVAPWLMASAGSSVPGSPQNGQQELLNSFRICGLSTSFRRDFTDPYSAYTFLSESLCLCGFTWNKVPAKCRNRILEVDVPEMLVS